jgi:hypothetical protein
MYIYTTTFIIICLERKKKSSTNASQQNVTRLYFRTHRLFFIFLSGKLDEWHTLMSTRDALVGEFLFLQNIIITIFLVQYSNTSHKYIQKTNTQNRHLSPSVFP